MTVGAWIPAFAGMTNTVAPVSLFVAPANAGAQPYSLR